MLKFYSSIHRSRFRYVYEYKKRTGFIPNVLDNPFMVMSSNWAYFVRDMGILKQSRSIAPFLLHIAVPGVGRITAVGGIVALGKSSIPGNIP
jgi:hypothetical protein